MPQKEPMRSLRQKILITGGSGNLGSELLLLLNNQCPDIDYYAPTKKEMNILNIGSCKKIINRFRPTIIIHCAAYTDVAGAENNKKLCFDTNFKGTTNIIDTMETTTKLVYISTEYVFDGEKGLYTENDIPNPVNFYALTKLLGEMAVMRRAKNSLIIRTLFKPKGPWKYPKVFYDQFTSGDFVDVMAPDILRASLTKNLTGIIHIGKERKSIYELAKRVSPEVNRMSIKEIKHVRLPRDTSLNSKKWERFKDKYKIIIN